MSTSESTTVNAPEPETSPAGDPAVGAGTPAQEACPACGASMAADQEWCLECGAARTMIHPPPDWRAGVAIVLGVIALVAILVIVFWP